jgi:hypothetical protein
MTPWASRLKHWGPLYQTLVMNMKHIAFHSKRPKVSQCEADLEQCVNDGQANKFRPMQNSLMIYTDD